MQPYTTSEKNIVIEQKYYYKESFLHTLKNIYNLIIRLWRDLNINIDLSKRFRWL